LFYLRLFACGVDFVYGKHRITSNPVPHTKLVIGKET